MVTGNLDKPLVFGDVERELAVTRKVLEAIPIPPHFDWKFHDKSMSLGSLALHVANLPDWAAQTLLADALDLASAPRPLQRVADTAGLLAEFDRHAGELRRAIGSFDMVRSEQTWTLRNGAQVIAAQPRPKVFREWCMNHLVHHRAQLCVCLRLLEVKVPTVYFNTADDPTFVFE